MGDKPSAIYEEAFRLEGEVRRLQRELSEAMHDRDDERVRANTAEAAAKDHQEARIRLASERNEAQEALAAARLEIEELRGAVALHLKCPEEAAVSCLAEIRDDFSVVDSALAAPAAAAGEEGT